jgi:uncharacterized protein (TIGR02588 family)
MPDTDTSERSSAVTGTSRLEWAAAALGGVLLISLIGYLAYTGLTAAAGPPRIEVRTGKLDQGPGGYIVQFAARNNGESTAAAVKVRGRLLTGDQVVEESEAVLDFVPERSEREGGLFFERDPRRHTLSIRAEGYAKP